MKRTVIAAALICAAFAAVASAGGLEKDRHDAGVMLDGTGNTGYTSLKEMLSARLPEFAGKVAEASPAGPALKFRPLPYAIPADPP